MRLGGRSPGGSRERTSDSYILDPLLVPRLEQYSYNNNLLEIDASVDYLRRNYREYRRKQQGPFRKLVLRAIQVLQKRLSGQGIVRTQRGDNPEIKLQRKEKEHSRRFWQDVQPGSSGGEDVTSSGSDDSSDKSEGVEGQTGSDNEGENCMSGSRFSGEKEGSGVEEANLKKRKLVKSLPGPAVGREKGKTGYGSDSGGDDELLGFSPAFNLLNSSLRTTYHGRPALVFEKSAVDVPAVVQSSRLGNVAVPVLASKARPCVVEQKEMQKPQGFASSPSEGNQNQAFAPPSVVAAAARAASVASKKRLKQLDGSASIEKRPVGEHEEGRHRLGSELELPLNCQGVAPGTHETTPLIKAEHNWDISGGVEQRVAVDNQGCKTVDTGSVSRQNVRAENTARKKRSRGTDKQENSNAASGVKSASSLKTSAEAVRFSDLGGIDGVLNLILKVLFPLYQPRIYPWLGLQPMGGILLHGPPGCGKTKLANAIAHETGLPFLKISAPEVVSGMSGESEAKVRGLFAEAARLSPCIIFIDEIDAITSKRENAQREMERRIVTQLMTCMDDLSQSFERASSESGEPTFVRESKGHVLVIGATNRPEALDPALRRPGRFDREISLGVPDENGRVQILSVLAKHLRLEGSFDFKRIARCTPGYVGADLAALTREAASIAIERIIASRDPRLTSTARSSATAICLDDRETLSPRRSGVELDLSADAHVDESMENTHIRVSAAKLPWTQEEIHALSSTMQDFEVKHSAFKLPWTQEEIHALSITMQDFEEAVSKVQPSTKREGFSAIPDVRWEDIGALGPIQKDLEFFISRRIKHPEEYQVLGLDMDTGFLLYGPPGCGKTLVAKAVANDAQANFIYIKGPELLNKYVGESEHSVRVLFSRARSCAPCIIFFDEMDALAPRRGTDGNAVAERVLNQLLTEMDGAEKRKGVFLIAATNRPDMLDPAMLRPGRLGKLVYVPLPDTQGRLSILKTLTRRKPISEDVDLASIAENEACHGLSGADLAALVNEACVAALQEKQEKITNSSTASSRERLEPLLVCRRHFGIALTQISPSVSKQDLVYYEELPRKFNQTRGMKGIPSETFA